MSDKTTGVVAIILAAGNGTRMGTKTRKQYLKIHGEAVLTRTLKAFDEAGLDRLILVVPPEDISLVNETILKQINLHTPATIIKGGTQRYDSVYQGLLKASACEIVVIHDGARPFVSQTIIDANIEKARQYQAVITAVPVKDTIKVAGSDGTIEETPDRSTLYAAQTPQTFQYDLIRKAFDLMYKETGHQQGNITDDAMVVQTYMGVKAHIVEGSYDNIKITTRQDLYLGDRIAQELRLRTESTGED